MEIAFLTYRFGRYAHGIGKYGWYLAYELRRLGSDVDIFTANFRVKKMGPLLHFSRNLLRKLQHYDVVHSNEGAGLLVFHPVMVETYHHNYAQVDEFGYRFFNIFENIECSKVQHIIVPSFASRNSLMRCGFPPSKISVIHHGVDHRIFEKDEVSRKQLRKKLGLSKRFVVINVGRLVKHKRQTTLIEVMQKLPNSILILVGEGEEERRINEMSSKMGVKMLRFRNVSERLLANLYNVADAYVHTSTLEGFGLTVLEAMACGLPVIAYNTADLKRIVGGAGFLFRIGDVESVRDILRTLQNDPYQRLRLSKIAVQRSKVFTWEESAKKHLEVYRELLRSAY